MPPNNAAKANNNNYNNRTSENGSLEVQVPGGGRLTLTGKMKENVSILTVLLLSFFFYWIIKDQETKANERTQAQVVEIQKMREAIASNQLQITQFSERLEKLTGSVDVNTFVLTMPQVEREKLDLRKPTRLLDLQR